MVEISFILFALWVSTAAGVGLAMFFYIVLMKPSLNILIHIDRTLPWFLIPWAACGILATILAIIAACEG